MIRDNALSLYWDEAEENPLNWPRREKYLILALVSYIDLLTPLTSMAFAPGLPAMQKDFHSHNDTLATFAMTIYVLGFCVGPLIFGPLSESYGRAIVYKGCLAMFLVFTMACGLASSLDMLVGFRFMAGCFGAAPVVIGGAMIYDLFRVTERGSAMAVYQVGPILGNILGPPIGGLIVQHKSWRWVFWIMSLLTVIALVCSLILLRETHAPVILAKQPASSQEPDVDIEGNETTPLDPNRPRRQAEQRLDTSEIPHTRPCTTSSLSQAFQRPLTLLFGSPVCAACSVVILLAAGTTNLLFASLGRIFQNHYGFSSSASGLVYLAVTIGFVIAAVIFGFTTDDVSALLTSRNHGEFEPEFRLPAMVLGLPLVAMGLVWYGWSTQNHVFWVVPVLGLNLVGMGITTVQLSLQIYIIDSFTEVAASALAAMTVARSIGGALIPVAGPLLYQRLGLGWGNSLLAFLNLVLCIIPCILLIHGRAWREKYLSLESKRGQ